MNSINIYQILSSKPHNPHYLKRYYKFILACSQANSLKSKEELGYTEKHHICPKAKDLFPEYESFSKFKWNISILTRPQHLVAHHILYKCFGGSMWFALDAMLNKGCMQEIFNDVQIRIKMRVALASNFIKTRPSIKGKCNAKLPDGTCLGHKVDVNDPRFATGELLKAGKRGFVAAIDVSTGKTAQVTIEEFNLSENLVGVMKGYTPAEDINGNALGKILITDVRFKTGEIVRAGAFAKSMRTSTQKELTQARRQNTISQRTPEEDAAIREKYSIASTGRVYSIERNLKVSLNTTGVPKTITQKLLDSRLKISQEKNDGIRPRTNVGRIPEKVTCPHCNKIIDSANAKRWHFDNCKLNPNKSLKI